MSCHGKVTHYRDGFGVKNKWTETCGLLSLLHLGLLFCHINIRTGPHYTWLPHCDGSAGSAPCTVLGCAGEPHPRSTSCYPLLHWSIPSPRGSCTTIPTAYPSGTTAFTGAGSAQCMSRANLRCDLVYSVFFPPWGPRGWVAGRVQDSSAGELTASQSSVVFAQHGRQEAKIREMFCTRCQLSNTNNSIICQQCI